MSNLKHSAFEHYKKLLDLAKHHKISPREKTFFDTAIRKHYENPTTELLEFFLNPKEAHELGTVFWQGFCDAVQPTAHNADTNLGNIEYLEREAITSNGNRIDLMIDTDSHLILLEAKIYHHQNNPFNDYNKFAQTKSKNRPVLKLILSISGKSEIKDWLSLSYQQLVNTIRPYLAEQMLINPMNKWNLFAREFLLHLESYYRIKNLDMNRTQFIFEHYHEIEALQKLKTNTVREVVDNTNQLLNESIEDYESYNKYEGWGGIRFYNQAWGEHDKSNNTLFIHEFKGETVFDVTTYILNLPETLQEQAFFILKCHDDSRFLNWKIEKYRGGAERWLCIYWRSAENSFMSIQDLILEKTKLLNEIQKTLK